MASAASTRVVMFLLFSATASHSGWYCEGGKEGRVIHLADFRMGCVQMEIAREVREGTQRPTCSLNISSVILRLRSSLSLILLAL